MKRLYLWIFVLMVLYPLASCNKKPSGRAGVSTQATANPCYGGYSVCTDSQQITVSGATITVPNNGGMVPTFEEIIAGGPASMTITISGCMTNGTCESVDLYSGTTNTIRAPSVSKTYSNYQVTASWTGGTNVSVKINTQITSAARPPGGGGGLPVNNPAFTGTMTGPAINLTGNFYTPGLVTSDTGVSVTDGAGFSTSNWTWYQSGQNIYLRDQVNGLSSFACAPGTGHTGECGTRIANGGTISGYNLAAGSTNQIWWDQNGLKHENYAVAPTSSAGTITGSNSAGRITGLSAATSVTITFANSGWGGWTSCTASPSVSLAAAPYVSAISVTAVTFSFPSLTGALYYNCNGN